MSNGITGLRGYQQGDLVEDDPGWWERLRGREREGARQSSEPAPSYARTPFFGTPRIPLNVRQLMADVTGRQVRERLGMEGLGNLIGSRDITAGDLSGSEYQALQDAVLRGMGGTLAERGGSLEYEDYATGGDGAYSDVGGSGRSPGFLRKLLDPSYSMKTTFGQAAIEYDPETGNYYVVDRYNFNRAAPDQLPMGESLDVVKNYISDTGLYGLPRGIGKAFGSPEGEGSIARVNLGDLQEALARSREPESPRGLAWLRNLFGRDEAGPQQASVDKVEKLKAELAGVDVGSPMISPSDLRVDIE